MKKWIYWGIPAVALIALVAWRFANRGETAGAPGGAPGGAPAGGQARGGPGGGGGGAGAGGAGGAGGGGGGRRGGGASSIEVAPATSRVITQSLQSVGNLESPYKIGVSPKTSGRITYIQAREGDRVVPGQVLLKIDPSELQGAVNQAKANVAEARSRLAQAKITQGSTNVGITSQIRQQQAAVGSAQAEYTQVQRNYDAQVQTAQSQVSAAESAVKNAQATLERENASLRNAQTRYDRTYSLYQQGFIAAQDVDDARTALDVQKGAVAVAQGQVDAARSQHNVQVQNLSIIKRKGTSDIAAARARLTQARATLDVAQANRSQAPAYRENIAALQASVDAAVGQLAQTQSRLSDTVVRSSISGTVTARSADPGALASPGTPVLEVQYLDWLYVTTTIPLDSGAAIREGQTAQVTIDSLPGRTFTGRITNLNPAADLASRQFGIRIRLNNPGHQLRPGMYARVNIITGRVNAPVVVPREAVKASPDGTSTVTVVDKESMAHIRPVKIGVGDEKGVQIVEGVQPGERVVTLSYATIRDGTKVTLARPGGEGGAGRGQGRAGGAGRREGAPAGGRRSGGGGQ